MKTIRRIALLSCVVLTVTALRVIAETSDARQQAMEAVQYAKVAYEFAQKANYNSEGRVKYWAFKAMEAAKKAEQAALKVVRALEAEQEDKK